MNDDFNMDSDDEGGGNEWLATYGDLVTLLLCFFVLLFAMSSIDIKKFKAAAASFAGGSAIGMREGGDSIFDLSNFPTSGSQKDAKNNETEKNNEMDELYEQVKNAISAQGLNGQVGIEKSERGILLAFSDDLFFDKGKAILKDSVKKILISFGDIIRPHNKKIRVEGHTDNVPISNSIFPSNWELSTARAISVVKFFTEELPPQQRMSASNFEVAGLAEYAPVVPNDSEENKQKNRRIELIILK